MFEIHFDYGEEEIDLAQARTRLSAASDFIAFSLQDLYTGPVPTEAVAPYVLQLEQQAEDLIATLDPLEDEAIGSYEVLDSLLGTCGSIDRLLAEIVNVSMEAGLSEDSVDEIDEAISPMIKEIYDIVLGGD